MSAKFLKGAVSQRGWEDAQIVDYGKICSAAISQATSEADIRLWAGWPAWCLQLYE